MSRPVPRALDHVFLAACTFAVGAFFVFDRSPGTSAALDGFPLDDPWIHLVYARSLAAGQGFAYNVGEPETGFTSPLWVVLLAPGFWLKSVASWSIVAYVKALCVALGAVTAILAARVTERLVSHRAIGLVAGLLVVVDPALAFARTSGMEVSLATTTMLGSTLALLAGRWRTATIGLALAPVVRPELAVFSVLHLPFVWMAIDADARAKAVAIRAKLATVLVTAAPFGAWSAFCLAVSGRPLPSTFYAKHTLPTLAAKFADLAPTLDALTSTVPMLARGAGVLAWLVGAYAIVRRGADARERALRVAIVATPLVLLVAAVWAHDLRQPLAFYWYRYLIPTLPGLALPIASGLAPAFEGAGRAAARTLDRVASAASALALAFGLILALPALDGRAELFAWNCQNVEEVQVTLGRWIARNVPPGATVAVNDAGALRYFGHHRTLDLLGLNAHRVLRDGLQSEMVRTRPLVFVVFPAWFPGLMNGSGLSVVHEAHSDHFTICHCNQASMVVLARRRTPSPATPP